MNSPTGSRSAGPLVIAHRGASRQAPENTLAAFELAWKQGADGIEGDFRLTSDGQVVCMHDADTERSYGAKQLVASSTLEQLRQAGGQATEPIPTLSEVLDAIPKGRRIFVELKVGPEIVQPVKKAIEASRLATDQLVLIAFDARTVTAAKAQMLGIRAHWLTSYSAEKLPDGQIHPTPEEILQILRATGADGLGTQARPEVVTPQFIEMLRKGGLREFHVWTVNSPQSAEHFYSLQPLAITTDFPVEMREWLPELK